LFILYATNREKFAVESNGPGENAERSSETQLGPRAPKPRPNDLLRVRNFAGLEGSKNLFEPLFLSAQGGRFSILAVDLRVVASGVRVLSNAAR